MVCNRIEISLPKILARNENIIYYIQRLLLRSGEQTLKMDHGGGNR
jgi:hypothetical protein